MLGISKQQVQELPEVQYPGKVIIIDSAAKARSAIGYLKRLDQIGFDTETRPSFQRHRHYTVSLVQLATAEECFLFRLKQIGSIDGLLKLLEQENLQKIGLSIKDDFHSLQRLAEFTPAGFVELQTFVKNYQIADNSLQKIYAILFNERISKTQRLTNWEAKELTEGQQQYAAIDAWACMRIYNHLISGKFHPEECPFVIDDETALQLQHSVGIHLEIPLNGEAGEQKTVSTQQQSETVVPTNTHTRKRKRSTKSNTIKTAETPSQTLETPTTVKRDRRKKSHVENTPAAAEKKASGIKTTRRTSSAKRQPTTRKSKATEQKVAQN